MVMLQKRYFIGGRMVIQVFHGGRMAMGGGQFNGGKMTKGGGGMVMLRRWSV